MVIGPRFYESLLDIEPINDRLQRATFDAKTPITIINAYAPQAYRQDFEKDAFYEEIETHFRKWHAKGPTFL
eukprot:10098783-Prorocentrum_lima.AAC.1